MRARTIQAAVFALSCGTAVAAEPPLALDHVIIYAQPGAPEQQALRQAGFTISPVVNRHDGQGTSSVTVEFLNGYFELIYLDAKVPVAPDLAVAAKRFAERADWRNTGISPLGLQVHKTASAPAAFPFPTIKVHADWMRAGENLEILTPREQVKAVGITIPPHAVDLAANAALAADPVKGAMFQHANGAKRMTEVEVIAPSTEGLPAVADYIAKAGAAKFTLGQEWLMVLTLDDAAQGQTRDLRPALPLQVRY
jgi:hypothetical protein